MRNGGHSAEDIAKAFAGKGFSIHTNDIDNTEEISHHPEQVHIHTAPRRLFSLKLLITIGILIIVGTAINGIEDKLPNGIENPLPMVDFDFDKFLKDFNLDIDLIVDSDEVKKHLDIVDRNTMISDIHARAFASGSDTTITEISAIIDFAVAHDKHEWKGKVDRGDETKAMENIEDRVDTMDCHTLMETFTGNTGWTARAYVAHTFIEKC